MDLGSVPSVWLHGAAMTSRCWAALCSDLPLAHAVDLPTRGGEAIASQPTVEAYATELENWIKEPTVLVGHSLGGMVAIELAARFPERIGALILIETVPTVRDSSLLNFLAPLLRFLLRCMSPESFLRLAGAGQSKTVKDALLAGLPDVRAETLLSDFNAAARFDGRSRLQGITCPTLVVTAKDTPATHKGAQVLVERIPCAQIAYLEGGHLLPIENPDGLLRVILAYLAQELQDGQSSNRPEDPDNK